MSKRIVILAVGGMMEDAVRRLNYTGVAIFRCGKHGNGVAHKTTMACLRERTDFMKCKICNGTGFVGIGPRIRGIKKCESCNGTGRVQGYVEVQHPVADVLIPVDGEMLKWLDMKQIPEDSQELVNAIREAVYLAYKRI